MTPILSRESRKRKRRIVAKATKALRELESALSEMKEFAEDHESLWRHSEVDGVRVDILKHDCGTIDIRPWLRSEYNVSDILHTFNLLSEDK